jgi:hypothetical protein
MPIFSRVIFTVREDISGLPELSVSYAKQSVLVRNAQ